LTTNQVDKTPICAPRFPFIFSTFVTRLENRIKDFQARLALNPQPMSASLAKDLARLRELEQALEANQRLSTQLSSKCRIRGSRGFNDHRRQQQNRFAEQRSLLATAEALYHQSTAIWEERRKNGTLSRPDAMMGDRLIREIAASHNALKK
jgi:hypothetical protein